MAIFSLNNLLIHYFFIFSHILTKDTDSKIEKNEIRKIHKENSEKILELKKMDSDEKIKNNDTEEEELQLVISLFRHGARTQIHKIKDLVFENKNLGYGDLTKVGIKGEYLLGRQLKSTYSTFFTDNFNKINYHLYSSNKNRTILSGQAYMMGLLEKGSSGDIENNKEVFYNPLFGNKRKTIESQSSLPNRIQIIPNSNDNKNTIFEPIKIYPNLKTKYNEIKKNLDKKYKKYFEPLFLELESNGYNSKDHFGVDKYDFTKASIICGYLISRKNSIPNFKISDNLFEQCKFLKSIINYSRFDDEELFKANNHNLIKIIYDSLNLVKNGDQNLKGVFFSGHDSNITTFIMMFKRDNLKCLLDLYNQNFNPSKYIKKYDKNECFLNLNYGTNILMELFKKNNRFFIKIKYNGSYFILSNNRLRMDLDDFLQFLELNMDPNFNEKFSTEFLEDLKNNPICYSILSLLIAIVIIMIIIVFRLKKKLYRDNIMKNQ